MAAVTGFRFRRLQLGLTVSDLAKVSGLTPYTVRRCEEGLAKDVSLVRVLMLAAALGITVEEGCTLIEFPGQRQRPAKRDPRNILENYMLIREQTLQSMALLLGVSPQTVSIQCGKKHPSDKYIARLAQSEDLSVPVFKGLFGAPVTA